ncbi:Ferritin-3 [Hibiscus syriacus]|uniref:Ferritin n=1 Tax=Hibiscus syriacus TaxID=106335 RepID=A0A6A3BYY0_HIBSY|nr:Ferritin-3 [Hibiscus syriacus]
MVPNHHIISLKTRSTTIPPRFHHPPSTSSSSSSTCRSSNGPSPSLTAFSIAQLCCSPRLFTTQNPFSCSSVFEPFEEVKKELDLVPTLAQASLARQKYTDECDASINEQINVEYNVSYVYHAMFAYFDRDNSHINSFLSLIVFLLCICLLYYQNKRGGKVKLQSIFMPLTEFDHVEKGDTLYAMDLALSLEKLTNEKLLNLHRVAEQSNDVQLTDFIEGEFLSEQVEFFRWKPSRKYQSM